MESSITKERMDKIRDITVEHVYAHNYGEATILHLLIVVIGMLEQHHTDLTAEELLEQYHTLHLTRGNQDEHE